MIAKQFSDRYILRFEKGDDFITDLTKFCQENSVNAAIFDGIGSFLESEIGFYKLANKDYKRLRLEETHEIASLFGNISTVEGKHFAHVHVVLTDETFNAKGGHLFSAITGATLELQLEKLDGDLERKFSEEIGLNLLT